MALVLGIVERLRQLLGILYEVTREYTPDDQTIEDAEKPLEQNIPDDVDPDPILLTSTSARLMKKAIIDYLKSLQIEDIEETMPCLRPPELELLNTLDLDTEIQAIVNYTQLTREFHRLARNYQSAQFSWSRASAAQEFGGFGVFHNDLDELARGDAAGHARQNVMTAEETLLGFWDILGEEQQNKLLRDTHTLTLYSQILQPILTRRNAKR